MVMMVVYGDAGHGAASAVAEDKDDGDHDGLEDDDDDAGG